MKRTVFEVLTEASHSNYAMIAIIKGLSGYELYKGSIYNVPFHICRSLVWSYEINDDTAEMIII